MSVVILTFISTVIRQKINLYRRARVSRILCTAGILLFSRPPRPLGVYPSGINGTEADLYSPMGYYEEIE